MSDYFDRVERQIVRNVEAGVPRSSRRPTISGYLATAAAVAVVIIVAGVFLLAHGSNPPPSHAPAARNRAGISVTFRAHPIDPNTTEGAAIDRSIVILRERLRSAFPGVKVSRDGDQIAVAAPTAGAGARARIVALAIPGKLAFYDWEADAITPNGKTVASQLKAQNPTALEISQGAASLAPGETGAGSLPIKQALGLASRLSPHTACVVLEAADPTGYLPANIESPAAQFYVLKDVPLLTGADITHPKAGTDPNAAQPAVTFGFTPTGAIKFKDVTRVISERGDRVSRLGETLNQHFAIALDGRILTVPYIDFKVYPDGITGANGADIDGGFTAQSARDVATILRYGPLPAVLTATG